VGSTPSGHFQHTLVEHWNGSTWSHLASTDPTELSGYSGAGLNAVACPRAFNCIAVGSYGRNGLSVLLADRYLLHAGYWIADAHGGTHGFGDATVLTPSLPQPAVSIASTDGGPVPGYWVTDARGDVEAGAHARPIGDPPTLLAGERVVSIAGSSSAHGYWFVTNLGRVIPRGDAHAYGGLGALHLNQPIVAATATSSGGGYYLVGADGGVFAFGDAHFAGSTAAMTLRQPIIGIAPNPTGHGYWLIASDGGAFSFAAPFHGSMGGTHLNGPIVGTTAYGDGYLMLGADGGVFNFSNQPYAGSFAALPETTSFIGIAGLTD
jgi:hypothetical protein